MSQPPSTPGPQGPDHNQQPGQYQGQPGYGQAQPKKSKKKWIIGCLGLVVLAIVLFAGCAALIAGGDDPASTPAGEDNGATEGSAESAGVVLNATSTGEASINWGTSDGQSSGTFTGQWSETYETETFEVYSIVVQDQTGAADAEVTCSITKDGEVLTEQTGSGAYAAITCSGS